MFRSAAVGVGNIVGHRILEGSGQTHCHLSPADLPASPRSSRYRVGPGIQRAITLLRGKVLSRTMAFLRSRHDFLQPPLDRREKRAELIARSACKFWVQCLPTFVFRCASGDSISGWRSCTGEDQMRGKLWWETIQDPVAETWRRQAPRCSVA
jgi:hypothetical protein